MTLGVLYHPDARAHDAGAGHPERPERIAAVLRMLEETGLRDRLEVTAPEPAARDLIEAVHEPAYIDTLARIDASGGGSLDPDTRMSPASLTAALRGSQGAVDAARRILEGTWDAGFLLMRPPGHHATREQAMGFCLTNHVAVAARWAVRSGAASRVAVVDWDAHHGNGTQDIFWEDPSVLYVSLHQYPWYPGTGDVTETGAGAGRGTTVNIPLPAGSGEDAYARAFEDVVVPALEGFAPELVCVSAGYDGHARDPLCMMGLGAGAFLRFTERLRGIGAGPLCVLEGGYDLDGLTWSVGATLCGLLGEGEPPGVPSDEMRPTRGEPEAHRWVERAVAVRRELGNLG